MNNKKQHIFDDPKNVTFLVRALYACCFVLFALDLVIHRHTYHELETITGFYAFYGCLACVILVLLARELRKLVMRDEDYYEVNDFAVEKEAVERREKDANGNFIERRSGVDRRQNDRREITEDRRKS